MSKHTVEKLVNYISDNLNLSIDNKQLERHVVSKIILAQQEEQFETMHDIYEDLEFDLEDSYIGEYFIEGIEDLSNSFQDNEKKALYKKIQQYTIEFKTSDLEKTKEEKSSDKIHNTRKVKYTTELGKLLESKDYPKIIESSLPQVLQILLILKNTDFNDNSNIIDPLATTKTFLKTNIKELYKALIGYLYDSNKKEEDCKESDDINTEVNLLVKKCLLLISIQPNLIDNFNFTEPLIEKLKLINKNGINADNIGQVKEDSLDHFLLSILNLRSIFNPLFDMIIVSYEANKGLNKYQKELNLNLLVAGRSDILQPLISLSDSDTILKTYREAMFILQHASSRMLDAIELEDLYDLIVKSDSEDFRDIFKAFNELNYNPKNNVGLNEFIKYIFRNRNLLFPDDDNVFNHDPESLNGTIVTIICNDNHIRYIEDFLNNKELESKTFDDLISDLCQQKIIYIEEKKLTKDNIVSYLCRENKDNKLESIVITDEKGELEELIKSIDINFLSNNGLKFDKNKLIIQGTSELIIGHLQKMLHLFTTAEAEGGNIKSVYSLIKKHDIKKGNFYIEGIESDPNNKQSYDDAREDENFYVWDSKYQNRAMGYNKIKNIMIDIDKSTNIKVRPYASFTNESSCPLLPPAEIIANYSVTD